MPHSLLLEWNVSELARAMHLKEEDVIVYFTDGRRVSFIIERRIRDALGWKLAPSEGSGYDLIDENENKWESRSISSGIYFCPSYMVGSGRRFEEIGFLAKLDNIAGYVCADIRKFPSIPVYIVPCELVRSLYRQGKLGAGTRISSAAFYSSIVPMLPPPRPV